MKPRVVYWNNIPAPYMVERFDAVARRGKLDFEAWFSARTEKGRSWRVDETEWTFPHRYLPSIDGGTYPLAVPTPLVGGAVPDLFVTLHAAPTFLLGSAIAASRGARTAFWVEVTFDALVRRRRWKESLKRAIFPRADGILTAGRDGADFATRYGASHDRIFVVPHVVDFEHYARGSSLSDGERAKVRVELGLRGVVFTYAGRLWLGKGLEYLVEAFADLQRATGQETSLVLIGDGEHESLLRGRLSDEGARNVVFAGFRDADTLPRLLAAADVFVFPALGDTFGMALSEAMACGLPVIATTSTGEVADRISDGVNGFVVPPADAGALRDAMSALAADADACRRMGDASRERVRGQSPEMWAEAFEDAVEEILARPRSRQRSRRRVRQG